MTRQNLLAEATTREGDGTVALQAVLPNPMAGAVLLVGQGNNHQLKSF
jgi:predicted peptidase